MMCARHAALLVATTTLAAILSAGRAPADVTIACPPVIAARGSTAAVQITLARTGDEVVAGTQNDLEFDSAVFAITTADCVINPAIGPDTEADKLLSNSLLDNPPRVRNIVAALDNVNPIPDGALYTCTFSVDAGTALGDYELTNSRVIASDPQGHQLPVQATNCVVTVRDATPTPTPIGFCDDNNDCPPGEVCVDHRCVTPTPSPTPIGFCNDNNDCPDGQVCVNHHCVTPTPSPTPIGFCNDNNDCPNGEVCVNHMCVTVTPTHKSGGGGGGCSCEIDPRDRVPRAGDALAVALPAIVLLLRRRARRTRR